MSGASDIGIRISLEGGKEAATQAGIVADSLKDVGDAAKGAGAGAVEGSGGIDVMQKSFGKLDESSLLSMNAIKAFSSETTAAMVEATVAIGKADLVIQGVQDDEIAATASTGLLSRAFSTAGLDAGKLMSDYAKFGKAVTVTAVAVGAIVTYEAAKMGMAYGSTTAAIAANANMSVSSAKKITDAFLTTGGTVTFNAQEMSSAFAPIAGQLSAVEHGALNVHTSMMFMNAAMNLSSASGEALSADTQSLTDVMQVYGLQIGKVNSVSDILYNTSRLTANSTTELSSTMDRLHSRLGQVMPSLADTSGLMYDLAQHGASGTRGTNMISGALTTLLSRSANVSSMLEKLGLNADSFVGPNGKFIGMANAIGLLQPRLAALPQDMQLLAEKTLFGSAAQQVMGQVVLAGVGAYDSSRAAVTRLNVVQEAARKQEQSLQGQVQKLKAQFHDWGIDLGQWLLPKLVNVGKWMLQHKPIVIALAAVIGTALVGAMVAWAASMVTAAGAALGLDAALSFSVVGTILALVGVLVYVAANWKTIWGNMKRDFDIVWHYLDGILHNDFVLALMGPLGELIFLGEHWKTIWHGMQDVVRIVWAYLKPIFEAVKTGIGDIGKAVHTVGGFLGGAAHLLGFSEGGVVPGPQGAPMLAMVHGGEVITPPQNIYNATGSAITPVMLGQAVSKVTPGSASSSVVPSQVIANGGGGSGQPTVIQLVVDRRVLAELVYDEMQNSYARR